MTIYLHNGNLPPAGTPVAPYLFDAGDQPIRMLGNSLLAIDGGIRNLVLCETCIYRIPKSLAEQWKGQKLCEFVDKAEWDRLVQEAAVATLAREAEAANEKLIEAKKDEILRRQAVKELKKQSKL